MYHLLLRHWQTPDKRVILIPSVVGENTDHGGNLAGKALRRKEKMQHIFYTSCL